MGFLNNLFSKQRPVAASLQRLPSGSMTVDRQGVIVMTTVPSSYPPEILKEIANETLRLFREARTAQLPLSELTIHYQSFSISAREMHGGAFIFLITENIIYSFAFNLIRLFYPRYEHCRQKT